MAQTPSMDSSHGLIDLDQSEWRGSTPGSANGLPVLSFDALRAETNGPIPAKISQADREFLELANRTSTYTVFQNLQTPVFLRPKTLMPQPRSAARDPDVHYCIAPPLPQVENPRAAAKPSTPGMPYPPDARNYQHSARTPTIVKRPLYNGIQTTRVHESSTLAHPAPELDHSRHATLPVATPGAPMTFTGRLPPPYRPVIMNKPAAQASTPSSTMHYYPSRSPPATSHTAPTGQPMPADVPYQTAVARPPCALQQSATAPSQFSFTGQISAIQRR